MNDKTVESPGGSNPAPKVWFVTGGSRGLGRAIVEEALRRGDNVIAAARSTSSLLIDFLDVGNRFLSVDLDVCDEEAAHEAVRMGLATFGRIDVLVNNAGYGIVGAVEEVSAHQVREIFATNVEGLLNVTRAVLPQMRASRRGSIVNISSQGGFSATRGAGVYSATKFAVEGISEALSLELAPLGISVLIVEPGVFRTDFFSATSIRQAETTISDYDDALNRDIAHDTHGRQPGDPNRAAAAIATVLEATDPPLRLLLGTDAIARVEDKLDFVARETEQWRSLSSSMGFAGE